MQVKFQVDRRAAVRRGINANTQVVTLDVDPATLTQEERDLLAERMTQAGEVCAKDGHGYFTKGRGYSDDIAYLDRVYATEPAKLVIAAGVSLPDLLAAIRAEDDAAKGYLAAEQKKKDDEAEKIRAATQAVLNARKTEKWSTTVWAWHEDGKLLTKINQYNPAPNGSASGAQSVEQLRPAWPYSSDESVKKTKEAFAWQEELDRLNAAAVEAAKKDAIDRLIANEREMAAAKARKEAGIKDLRAWADKHGSELLKARIVEGYEWVGLAEREYAQAIVADLGDEVEREGECDENERTTPTLDEIKRLREARKLLDGKDAEAELVWCEYEAVRDEYGDEEEAATKQAEIKVTVTCPTGRELEFWFPVKQPVKY